MAYNPFRWYTSGKYRKKPLKSNAPLLLRIQNGDFDYSPFLKESVDEEKNYQKKFDDYMKTSKVSDINERMVEAHQHARMRRIASQKLMEKGLEEEMVRLSQLRKELQEEFGVDLWDKALEKQKGKGTAEDLYFWYKDYLNIFQTKSELAIMWEKKTAKNLPNIKIGKQ
jgi:hypothetical protein